jgi:hypothetical protein
MTGMTGSAIGSGAVRPEDEQALGELAHADVLAFGGVGLASQVLPATEAFHALCGAVDNGAGASLRPALEELLRSATPAGKVYAALLLTRLDPVAGRAAWQGLARDRAEVTTFSGCVMNKTTLAEYAADQLSTV